jgi:hypothetical protein
LGSTGNFSIGVFHTLLSGKTGHPAIDGDAEALLVKAKRLINTLKRYKIFLMDSNMREQFI